jgi:hypothetical protein
LDLLIENSFPRDRKNIRSKNTSQAHPGFFIPSAGHVTNTYFIGADFSVLSGFKETHNLAVALTSGRFISLQNLSNVAAQASINTRLPLNDFRHLNWRIDLSVGFQFWLPRLCSELIVSLVPNYSFLGFEACLLLVWYWV